MPDHNEHHFIPAFLLREWERGEDLRLTSMRWKHGAVRIKRYRAKAVAKLTQLYTLRDLPEHAQNVIEKKVFQKIDDEGAVAHAEILRGGLPSLSDDLVANWARFIVALLIRSPWFIQRYVEKAPRIMRDTIAKTASPDEDVDASLSALITANPNFASTLTLRSLVALLPTSKSHEVIQNSPWTAVDLSDSPIDLVIGDRPVIRTEGGFQGDFMLAFPISPKMLFIVHPTDSTWAPRLNALPPRELVRRVNIDSASQAVEYLFATSSGHIQLAKRYLRRGDSGQQLFR